MSGSQQNAESSIARDCGQCFGHILAAIRTPVVQPSTSAADVRTIGAQVLETTDGAVTRRRIVIDQIVRRTTQLPPALGTTS